MKRQDPSERSGYRWGAAALAMFAGMVVGFAVFVGVAVATGEVPSPAAFVFGGAGAGIMTGVFYPDAAIVFFEGTLQFLAGAVTAEADTEAGELLSPQKDAPHWYRPLFLFGILYVVALWLLY